LSWRKLAGMVGRRWVTGLAAMGLFVVACAQDKTPPPSDDELSSSPPDAAVLRSYVEALAEGDVDSAMELRCRNARQEGDAQSSSARSWSA
jgi:hypothetical protein